MFGGELFVAPVEKVDTVGDGDGEIVEAPEIIDADGNGIPDWIEDVMSKGYTIELGPEKMSKTKHSKKLLGKNKTDHRFVVLASHMENGENTVFYHCGDPAKPLDFDKQSLPIDEDTVLSSGKAGFFTVMVSASKNPDHCKAGETVAFRSDLPSKEEKMEQALEWADKLEYFKTASPAEILADKEFEATGLCMKWREHTTETGVVTEDGRWALSGEACDDDDDFDDVAEYLSNGKFRPATWADLNAQWDEWAGDATRTDMRTKAQNKALEAWVAALGLENALSCDPHGGADEFFCRHDGLNHFAKNSAGGSTDSGEVAMIGSLALTPGPRCDAALNNMPRVLLMRAREDGDPSKDEAKSAAAAAREAEVPHKQYKALDKGVIREGEDGESPKVGNLTPGRLIVALEEVGNRVRYTEGWVSKESKKGVPLLEFVQGGTRRDKEEQAPAIEAPEG